VEAIHRTVLQATVASRRFISDRNLDEAVPRGRRQK